MSAIAWIVFLVSIDQLARRRRGPRRHLLRGGEQLVVVDAAVHQADPLGLGAVHAPRRTRTAANVACGPAMRRNIHVWPPPGWMPICRKRVSNLARRAAMRTSQPSARFIPAPTAAPFTAASVGSGLRAMRRKPS